METSDLTQMTPRLAHLCPHCGGVLDLTSLTPPATTTADIATDASPLLQQKPSTGDCWFPIKRLLCPLARPGHPIPGLARRLRWWLYALLLLFLLALLIWQQWAGPVAPTAARANITSAASPVHGGESLAADQAAVLRVVAAYNAAESEVAQTLVLTPSLPLIEPGSPLAQRRAQELAQRQESNSTHATHLLRWAVGAITVDPAGTTATVATQETWEDQVGSNLPRTATVRVVYTLRRADAQSAWRIVDATSTLL